MAAAKLLVAKENFVTELDGKELLVHVGQVFPAGHKLVKSAPHLFAPAEPQVTR
jgi:hypothetical protein